MATARGVSRDFCRAFTDLAATSKEADGQKGLADRAVARRLERDGSDRPSTPETLGAEARVADAGAAT